MTKPMKTTLTIIAALLCLTLSAQKIDSTISEGKFGALECEFYKTTEDSSSRYFLGCSFQNAEYQYITDLGFIFISNQETLDSLISDLTAMLPYLGTKTNISYDRGTYSLTHYDFASPTLYVMDENGKKYCRLNKKQATSWLEWLKTIKFPQ